MPSKIKKVIGVFKEYITLNGKKVCVKKKIFYQGDKRESIKYIELANIPSNNERYKYKHINYEFEEIKHMKKFKEEGMI